MRWPESFVASWGKSVLLVKEVRISLRQVMETAAFRRAVASIAPRGWHRQQHSRGVAISQFHVNLICLGCWLQQAPNGASRAMHAAGAG